MDLLQEIRDRIAALPDTSKLGLLDVLRHLEHCDRLLTNGRSDTPEFFNDIIYRTNQAFEGALKEAYRTLENKDPDKVALAKVESELTRNSLVRPKVITLMKNYRTEWRNPSTHDYTLRFDESEGILAIASVSAFFLTLLGQIRDKVAIKPAEDAARQTARTSVRPGSDLSRSVLDVLKSALPTISLLPSAGQTEAQAVLLLAEALAAADRSWKVMLSPKQRTPSGAVYEADLVVVGDDDTILVEIARGDHRDKETNRRIRVVDRMLRYMRASRISRGILVRLPFAKAELDPKKIAESVVSQIDKVEDGLQPSIVEIGFFE